MTDILLIDKELTLRSNNPSRRAVLAIKFDLHRYKFLIALFNITKSFTLNAVHLNINQTVLDFADVALLLISASHINVTLTDNIFQNIRPQFRFISKIKANVVMKDCVVENAPFLIMNPIKSTFLSNADDSGKILLSADKKVTINVNQCNFRKSYIMFCYQKNCNIDIKGSNFSSSVLYILSGIKTKVSVNSIFLESTLFHAPEYFPGSQLIIQNVSFIGSGVFGHFNLVKPFQMKIDNCDNITIKYCKFENSANGALYAYKSNVFLIGSTFTSNQQLDLFEQAGVVQFLGSSVFMKGCHFENNSAPTSQGGTIKFANIDRVLSDISITNTTVKGGIHPQHFDNSLISILATPDQTLFVGTVNISCPVNYKLHYNYEKNYQMTNFLSLCQKCDSKKYSVEPSKILWSNVKQMFENHIVKCLPCPYEAICEQGIRSKGNYWGFKTKTNLIRFVYCPTLYCCTSISSCLSYDTCNENRHKRLCGECLKGYSVGIFGYNHCFKSTSCVRSYFWSVYILLIGLYVLFFLYLQEIIIFTKRAIQILIGYHEKSSAYDESYEKVVDRDNLDELSCHLVVSDNETLMEYAKKSCIIAGLIKIVFFFYQTALIIRINSSTKAHYFFTGAADLVLSFFNVKIDISSTSIKICPFESSDVLSVEIIKSGILILCPFILLFVALLYSTCKQIFSHINYFHQIKNNKEENTKYFSTIDDRVLSYAKLPFIVRIKRTYFQLLLVSFACVALLLFKMINCVEILGQKYLFMKATIPCYTVWQKGLIVLIGVWVIPFSISLYISSYLLRNCEISPNEFIFISLFPLTVFYYLLKAKFSKVHTFMNTNNAMLAKEFLRVINEPFRNVSGKSYKLQWESTLLYRRLLLIIVCTFLISPFEKLYPIGFILGLYLIHHIIVQPYNDILLNVAEGVSLAALCFLTLLNTFWAFTDEVDITENNLFMTIGQVFIYVELGILLTPILAVFGFVLFVLYRKYLYKRDEYWEKCD